MKINHNEWVAPIFLIPKKGGQVRFIYDFSQLNKQVKHMPYPSPHIKYIINKISKFNYATALYLIMGYYNISLTDVAKKLCTITSSFGKYEYNRLSMGVYIAPDIFQEHMSALMENLFISEFILMICSLLNQAHSRSTSPRSSRL